MHQLRVGTDGATPATLSDQLADPGHTASSTRFWPFVSPVVFLLAIGNAVAARRHAEPGRRWWSFASLALIVMSISTYAYFVPRMLTMTHRSDTMGAPEQLSQTMTLRLRLSGCGGWIALPTRLALLA